MLRIVFLSIGFVLVSSPVVLAKDCSSLWYERNAIFDDNGYCFKSNLGKVYFDNSDCYTHKAQLSEREAQIVAHIKREEKRLGCKINNRLNYLP